MDVAKRITLTEAIEHFPKRNGKRIHRNTIVRYVATGCRGVKLTAVKSGGVWYTTKLWIEEFQRACTMQSSVSAGNFATAPPALCGVAHQHLMERFGIDVDPPTQ